MRIYFAGSIAGGRQDAPIYAQLIEHLSQHGEVVTEHIGNPGLSSSGEPLPAQQIHDRDVEWLLSCDVIVADVTVTSLGVGYELGRAVAAGKRVLCLHRPVSRLSPMLAGCGGIIHREYSTVSEAKDIIDGYFQVQQVSRG